ncbi:ATP-dependent Clp protease proteolytic subunit-like [Impatiens glandulifera]|uniref:ATP-dependent Clp protease proteolytic subunit-like n=1 Tax=Impatiens glandulifera TaxID=253017 RepID=UPI001FB0BC83|nr:ATP-dependent Clp protease proteolytic subunit-like [Impatiens glandulifera]
MGSLLIRITRKVAVNAGLLFSSMAKTSNNMMISRRLSSAAVTKRSYSMVSDIHLKERNIYIIESMDKYNSVNNIIKNLLFLESENPSKPINLYINYPFGVPAVYAGMAIYDAMQYIRCPINTICLGQAMEMSSLLLAAGTNGRRFALPNSEITIYQTAYHPQMDEYWVKKMDVLSALYFKHTGQTVEIISEKHPLESYILTPEKAKKLGLIDEVVIQRPDGLMTVQNAPENV